MILQSNMRLKQVTCNMLSSFVTIIVILHYVAADTTPNSSEAAVTVTMSKLSDPSNDFGFRFLGHINSNEANKNVLFSPLSILLAYSMLLEGATGKTKDQIMEILHLSSISNESSGIAQASKKLLEEYKLIENGSSDRNFSLAIGNLLMMNQNYTLKEKYASSLRDNYMAEASSEDFNQGEALVTKLNSWVAEKTRNKIEKLLDQPPDPETILMLINTVYFKGKWEEPFKMGDTIDDTFHNSDGTESKIKMMYQRDRKVNFAHLQDKKLKIVELPYIGNISMIFIMPTESNDKNLTSLVSNLNASELTSLLGSMNKMKLRAVGIPKFKLEDSHKLHELLPQMGLALPFSDEAQLNELAEGAELKVSKSLQKCVIEVDEKGSEATAATFILTVLRMSYFPAEDFIADKPFIFIIRDNISGVNLFMGQINKMSNVEQPVPEAPTTATPEPTSKNETSS